MTQCHFQTNIFVFSQIYVFIFLLFKKYIWYGTELVKTARVCVLCCHAVTWFWISIEKMVLYFETKMNLSLIFVWHYDTFKPTYSLFSQIYVFFMFFQKVYMVWNKHINWKSCVGWCHAVTVESQPRKCPRNFLISAECWLNIYYSPPPYILMIYTY